MVSKCEKCVPFFVCERERWQQHAKTSLQVLTQLWAMKGGDGAAAFIVVKHIHDEILGARVTRAGFSIICSWRDYLDRDIVSSEHDRPSAKGTYDK